MGANLNAAEDDTITLTIRVVGEATVTLDRANYDAAKAEGRLDRYLDRFMSDLDGESTVTEPDGRSYAPVQTTVRAHLLTLRCPASSATRTRTPEETR